MSKTDVTREEVETFRSGLLTTKDVARLMRVGERSIWRWSHSRQMPAPVRIGGAVRFRESELLEWIQSGCPRVDGRATI